MKLQKIDRQKVSYSFIFSIALHMSFMLFMAKTTAVNPFSALTTKLMVESKEKNIKFDSVKIISKKQLQAIRDTMNKQIVANETNGRNERPVASRFLGEKDQTFDRQTQARINGSFKEAGLGKKTGSKTSVAQTESTTKKVAEAPPKKAKKQLTLSDLGGFSMADVEKMEKKTE